MANQVSDVTSGIRTLKVAHNGDCDEVRADDKIYEHKPPTTPITSFPLPQELKDEIYSYLILGTNVQLPADEHRIKQAQRGKIASNYDFDTSILLVNKTIGGEAHTYLYKNNTFIKIKYVMPGLPETLACLEVPTISSEVTDWKQDANGRIGRFEQQSVELDLHWGGIHCSVFFDRGEENMFGKLLLLGKDWPAFCGVLQLACYCMIPSAVSVSSRADIPLRIDAGWSDEAPRFHVKVTSAALRTIHASEQRAILKAVGSTIGLGGICARIKLTGFLDEKLVESALDTANPSLIWLRAMDWDRVDAFDALKTQANALGQAGAYDAAHAQYIVLFKLLQFCVDRDNIPQDQLTDPVRADAKCRLQFLITDCSLALAAVELHLGQEAEAYSWLMDVEHAVESSDVSAVTLTKWEHLVITSTLLCQHPSGRMPVQRATLFHSLLTSTLQDKYAAHDVDILAAAFSGEVGQLGLDEVQVSVDKLSIFVLPFRTFDSYTEAGKPPRPAGLVGWQDLDHLEKFSETDKEEIQKMQRESGLRVTTFD